MSMRSVVLYSLATLLLVSITGCTPKLSAAGPSTAVPESTYHVVLASSSTEAQNSESGGEVALVTHTDTVQGFSIAYPGNWTQVATSAGVQFAGGDDSMKLELATLPSGMSAMVYARADVAAVSTAYPGFRQIGLAASTEVKNAVVLGFEAKGVSTITGKPLQIRADRYYMPLPNGRIAVLTVATANNRYDREGVRDIALTFKLLK
jgi:hypothetical protein